MALRFCLIVLVIAVFALTYTQAFPRDLSRHGRQFSSSQASAQSYGGGFGGSSSSAQSSSVGGGLHGLGGYGGMYGPGYGGGLYGGYGR